MAYGRREAQQLNIVQVVAPAQAMCEARNSAPLIFALVSSVFMAACGGPVGAPEGEDETTGEVASALTDQEFEVYYYSDATHTNLVGWKSVTCYGNYSWGQWTTYRKVIDGRVCCPKGDPCY